MHDGGHVAAPELIAVHHYFLIQCDTTVAREEPTNLTLRLASIIKKLPLSSRRVVPLIRVLKVLLY